MCLRVVRWVVNGVVALSLLLSAGAAGLWVRSHWVPEEIAFPADGDKHKGPSSITLTSCGGHLFLSWREPAGNYNGGGVLTRMFGPHRRWAWTVVPWMHLSYAAPTSFHLFSPPRYMNVPHWMCVAVFALPGFFSPARAIKPWRRRRWRAKGCCIHCGYDLRATPQRCPECGNPVISPATPHAKPRLRWPFLALGALCILIATAWGLCTAQDHRRCARYQKMAGDASWTWSDEEAKIEHSIGRARGIVTAGVSDRDRVSKTIEVSRDGKSLYQWRGGWDGLGAFVVRGNRLVYAEYLSSSCGCTLMGVDLESGEVLWRNSLSAAGMIRHSAYSNEVAMDLSDDVVIVRGNEDAGRYIEIVDFNSGQTLAHRRF